MGALLMPPPRVLKNPWPSVCGDCNEKVPPEEGEFRKNPVRLLCQTCLLFDPGGLARLGSVLENMAPHWGAREIALKPFQREDVERVAQAKKLLIRSQPGTGKTIVAAVAGLRKDLPNLLSVPASVVENWVDEINTWRPDLEVDYIPNKACFEIPRKPGLVLIGSYGSLPGDPCKGCKDLRSRLKSIKRERDLKSLVIPKTCLHANEGLRHPEAFKVMGGYVPFHILKTPDGEEPEICEGCWQQHPVPDFDWPIVLLADEAHAFKNPTAQRTRNWRGLRERVEENRGYVFGLTGTPCEGKAPEFWQVMVSLGLESAFGSWAAYYQIFQGYYDNKKGSRKPPNSEQRRELHCRLSRISINRRRKDVLKDLPPRAEEVIRVKLSAQTLHDVNQATHRMLAVRKAMNDIQRVGYRSLADPFVRSIREDERDRRKLLYEERVEEYFKERPTYDDAEVQQAVEEALTSSKVVPQVTELARIRRLLSLAKIAAVEQWVKDREEEEVPVVLFSQHVAVVKKFGDERPGWASFHGSLSKKARHKLVKRFQSGEIANGLAVSIGAGGEGITLTRASVCAFVDLNWVPGKNRQAESRLVRMGAEKHHLLATERAILEGCTICRWDGNKPLPCEEHQARVLVVRFIADHAVDRLVLLTLKEKEELLEAIEEEEEVE